MTQYQLGKLLFRITIPGLPFRELGTNSRDGRLHWRERSDLVGEARMQVLPIFNIARQTIRIQETLPIQVPVVEHWTLYVPDYKQLDWVNAAAALKPWEDMLCRPSLRNPGAVGILMDDNPKWVRGASVSYVIDKARTPETVLEVYEA